MIDVIIPIAQRIVIMGLCLIERLGSLGRLSNLIVETSSSVFFFFQAEDGIRDWSVTGVQTCALFIQAEDGIRDWSVTGVQTCALPIRRHTRLVSDWSSDVCSSDRSEEHTSELQSLTNLVCRLLL